MLMLTMSGVLILDTLHQVGVFGLLMFLSRGAARNKIESLSPLRGLSFVLCLGFVLKWYG
ncbi:hypothetical protein LINPERPRIM_LOCUS27358 [Linum perenne]